jgi:hypothetical protein
MVVHFTKSDPMNMERLIGEQHPLHQFKNASAKDKLMNILTTRTIHASPMPFIPGNPNAVSFTESNWESLIKLAERYSPYGVVFSKRLIFNNRGGPALYIRGDTLNILGSNIPSQLAPFIAPFDPDSVLKPGVRLDWLREREWRLPSSLQFQYSDLKHLLVDTMEDADYFVRQIGSHQLPSEKVIPLEVYGNIKRAWGP